MRTTANIRDSLLQRLKLEAERSGTAALALEYGATLCSSDNDFMRFGSQLGIYNPLL